MVVFMLSSPTVTLVTFFAVVSVLFTASYGSRVGTVMVGKKTDMGDVRRNKEVQELGKFSVDEFNERVIGVVGFRNDAVFAGGGDDDVRGGGGKKVEFMKVVEAKKQVVEGTRYYLKIWAVDEKGRYREFDSVVEVKPWLTQNAKQLVSFAPSQRKRSDQKDDDDDDDDESVLNSKKLISSV